MIFSELKISVGCHEAKDECDLGPRVKLEFSKEGGSLGWDLVRDSCLPGISHDPDCLPYVFHNPSVYAKDSYATWHRVTIPLPEKTWSR